MICITSGKWTDSGCVSWKILSGHPSSSFRNRTLFFCSRAYVHTSEHTRPPSVRPRAHPSAHPRIFPHVRVDARQNVTRRPWFRARFRAHARTPPARSPTYPHIHPLSLACSSNSLPPFCLNFSPNFVEQDFLQCLSEQRVF